MRPVRRSGEKLSLVYFCNSSKLFLSFRVAEESGDGGVNSLKLSDKFFSQTTLWLVCTISFWEDTSSRSKPKGLSRPKGEVNGL